MLKIPYSVTETKTSPPLYASPLAAGCDLRCSADIVLRPGETILIPTDIAIALPEGYEAQIRPRSGLSLKTSLRLANSPGTIDADYRDTIGLIAENTFDYGALLSRLMWDNEMLTMLNTEYRRTTIAEVVNHDLPAAMADWPVWLDAKNNPYGTLYFDTGERIAQMVIAKIEQAAFYKVADVKQIGADRGGGFGSTGRA